MDPPLPHIMLQIIADLSVRLELSRLEQTVQDIDSIHVHIKVQHSIT
jgi:hypothetical protein